MAYPLAVPPTFHALFERGCETGQPLAALVNEVLTQQYGQPADIALVTMGTNNSAWNYTPTGTVDEITLVRNFLAPSEVRISPPLPRQYPPPTDWPDQVRAVELEQGLITGPDWFLHPPSLIPGEGFHQDDAGWIMFAAGWYGSLCPTPALDPPVIP